MKKVNIISPQIKLVIQAYFKESVLLIINRNKHLMLKVSK